jgi:two-component system, cell cycle response regulator
MHPNMRVDGMPPHAADSFLVASSDPAVLAAIEPSLLAGGAHLEIALTAEAVVGVITGPHPPGLMFLDENLPGMPIEQLLAACHACDGAVRIPIVLIADSLSEQWIDRLSEGAIDDIVLRTAEPLYWLLRLDLAMRNQRVALELESLRDAALRGAQLDRLTGVYHREALLAALFRETDRVQRMNGPLSLVLFDIDDFGHWNSRLGTEACDELLCQVVARTAPLLRSYDLLGRPGMDEFLIALPACGTANALALTERLRGDVFASPFHVANESVRLSACFGIAASHGRSPVVVLREAEKTLEWAKAAGPESIQCFGSAGTPSPSPVTFFSATSGDELLAW